MQVEIKEIQQRLGLTVVYVTHDQEEALTMSDRIAIMDGGRIAQMGPPREVYERPGSSFVGKFLGEANLIAVHRRGNEIAGAGGVALQARQGSLAQDGTGWVFVRPEKISLSDAGSDACPGLAGTIRHVSFLGNVVRYAVDTGADGVVVCDAANAAAATPRAAGDRVALHWRPEDGRLLAR